ncbi:diacylglycerol kinase theta [Pistacia vera]|uniref:diacylglycerol kinase theta n=1 Tax=Pistacia vera TaxID=55513 RepID=UPI001263983F|nr:diacylglycerol kinase theta [Pistacia vera]
MQHFTHPSHLLYKVNYDQEYLCNGCNTKGARTRYRCNLCDFDLHEYCATCPTALSSFMHPQHQLDLLVRTPEDSLQNPSRFCHVCRENIGALFYRCNYCEFNLHPICTQFPQQLRHVLHPDHPLTLQPSSSGLCMVCKRECSFWRYRCGICCFDIHFECVSASCGASKSTSGSVLQSNPLASAAPPPGYGPYGPYCYGYFGGPSGFSPYYNMYHHNQHGHINYLPHSGGEVGPRPSGARKIIYQIVASLTATVIADMVFGL